MFYSIKDMKNQLNTLPAISDDGSLARYVQRVQQFPILSAKEEYEYATSWVKNHDKMSAEKLISSHLRMVVSMAYELHSYGIPIGELIASGNVGLMQALQKFEPERGFRFSTYATFWIKAEMYDMILSNWSMVKMGTSATQKKIFFNLARTKKALGIMDSRLSGEQAKMIAEKLDVSEDDVINMNSRIHSRDTSLNANKYDEDGSELQDFIADDQKPIDDTLADHELEKLGHELLKRHLSELPERDREILISRKLSDPIKTLEELSEQYSISRERVRQIEERAYAKLRSSMLEEVHTNRLVV
jgi:RNA polymerase sigma-32 factor